MDEKYKLSCEIDCDPRKEEIEYPEMCEIDCGPRKELEYPERCEIDCSPREKNIEINNYPQLAAKKKQNEPINQNK